MFDDIIERKKYTCDFKEENLTTNLKRPLKEWKKCPYYISGKNNLCIHQGYKNLCHYKKVEKFNGKYFNV